VSNNNNIHLLNNIGILGLFWSCIIFNSWNCNLSRAQKKGIWNTYRTLQWIKTWENQLFHNYFSKLILIFIILIISCIYSAIKFIQKLNVFAITAVSLSAIVCLVILEVFISDANSIGRTALTFIASVKCYRISTVKVLNKEDKLVAKSLRITNVQIFSTPIKSNTFLTILSNIILAALINILITFWNRVQVWIPYISMNILSNNSLVQK